MNTSFHLKLSLLLVFLPFVSAYPLRAAVIYVDANATGANNGSSWTDAYKYLQDALTPAGSGDSIWVAQGTYRPDEDTAHPDGNDSRYATFQLRNRVAVYGGFPAGGGIWESRDPDIYHAILSGNIGSGGNHGTAQQNTSVLHTDSGNPPYLNGALTFNGSSDYVNVGNVIGTGAYTKAAWVKRTGGNQNNIISSSTWSHVFWAPSERSYHLSAGHGSSVFLVEDSETLQAGVWYFVAVTFDPAVGSGRMVLYKNGNKVDDANDVPTQTASTTYIGRFLTGYAFMGSIDNVLIFNRALTADEISYLYNNGNGTEVLPAGGGHSLFASCVGHWRMNDNAANTTVLDSSIKCNSDNSYHVLTASGTDSNTILDGFTITAGEANGLYPYNSGGAMINYDNSDLIITNCIFIANSASFGAGMVNYYSNPTVTDCTFTENSTHYGGGIYNFYCSLTIINCTFTSNSAIEYGGGMFNYQSSSTVTNCTFTDNSSDYGGGMYNYYSSSTLTNCAFSGNSAAGSGGGMSCELYSNSTVTNCTFTGNSATSNGGGMDIFDHSSPNINNCIFSGNSTLNDGGGMVNSSYSNPNINNCVFIANSAANNGGGMVNYEYSEPNTNNCTFTGNFATNNGGGIYNYYSTPILVNCILWGNTAPNNPQIYNSSSTPTVSFSDIQGGWSGTGNINADPLFVDADGPDNIIGTEDDNLRLSMGSSCIDAADNTAVPEGIETDLDGRDRFADGDCNSTVIVDMGAYEFTHAYFGDFDSDCYVDLTDFAIFANQWLLEKLSADIAPGKGDGIVNFIDYAVFADGWQHNFNGLTDLVSQWLKPGPYGSDIAPVPAGDGLVDTSDLAVLCVHWLETF